MDIGIDTIIYIALGLIFVLAQVSRKKRAAKQAQSQEVESVPEVDQIPASSAWDEFWNSSDPSPEQDLVTEATVPQVIDDTLSFPVRKAVKQMDVEDEIRNTELRSDWKSEATEEPEPETVAGDRIGFDLRSAVVYSVLLERKEF